MSVKSAIMQNAISALLAALPDDYLKDAADKILDIIENKVKSTESPYDDAVVMPIVRLIRASFDIPDND